MLLARLSGVRNRGSRPLASPSVSLVQRIAHFCFLPAKSGVGGGIIAVAPGKFGIAAFSPPLDEAGNSVRAQKAIEMIVNQLGANLYVSQPAK